MLAVDNSEAALVETIERVKALGGTMETHIGDATESQSVAGMIQACMDRFLTATPPFISSSILS